jgi:ABC-2 type transport system permease protein
VTRFGYFMRQALTVARRDFSATVLTPTFLLFLLSPVIMIAFGSIGGFGAAAMEQGSAAQPVVVAVVAPGERATMTCRTATCRR